MTIPAPSVGRIVHVLGGAVRDPLPAIVVAVPSGYLVNVQIFNDRHSGATYMRDVPHEKNALGDLFWRWPPRV